MPGSVSDEAEREGRAARMFDALNALELRERRNFTLAELGVRIAEAEGRAKPYAPSVVRRWIKAIAEPGRVKLWRAIGAVLGADPRILAFGDPVQVRGAADTHGLPVERVDRPLDSRDGPPAAAARRRPKAG